MRRQSYWLLGMQMVDTALTGEGGKAKKKKITRKFSESESQANWMDAKGEFGG